MSMESVFCQYNFCSYICIAPASHCGRLLVAGRRPLSERGPIVYRDLYAL